jgi:putative flippase GtrA
MFTRRASEWGRLAVFGLVGTLNTALCYAAFVLLVHVCGWHHDVALAADYTFGIALGYVLHRFSTFADRRHLRQAFGKYALTLVATFAANLALLDAIVRAGLLGPLFGQAVAMTAVTLASYLAQKHWVFRSHGATAMTMEHAHEIVPERKHRKAA